MKSYGLLVARALPSSAPPPPWHCARHGLKAAAVSGENFSRAELLHQLLVDVVQRYEPEVAEVLRGVRTSAGMPAALLARTLQAQGIWFQLLAIAEQNRDMRNRRDLERERGYVQLRGTFAGVFAAAAREGLSAAQIREAMCGLRVRPVITAHPTEAKRVTVMEQHRRIYLKLFELESPRWTDRERDELIRAVRDEMEPCGSPASSSSRNRPLRRKWPGVFISSMRICSTSSHKCSRRYRAHSRCSSPTSHSMFPCFFSSDPGSAAIVTGIRT